MEYSYTNGNNHLCHYKKSCGHLGIRCFFLHQWTLYACWCSNYKLYIQYNDSVQISRKCLTNKIDLSREFLARLINSQNVDWEQILIQLHHWLNCLKIGRFIYQCLMKVRQNFVKNRKIYIPMLNESKTIFCQHFYKEEI